MLGYLVSKKVCEQNGQHTNHNQQKQTITSRLLNTTEHTCGKKDKYKNKRIKKHKTYDV